jgi:mRNA-degrading endonuclease RelE of RelBE toxin-antitoxin system
MKILDRFTEEQKKLLQKLKIDIDKEFDKESLEDLEDKIYNIMMDNLDKNQDFTPKALEIEKLLDIVVDIENNL